MITQSIHRTSMLLGLIALTGMLLAPPASAEERATGRYIVVLKDSVKGPATVAGNQIEQRDGELGMVYRHALKGYSAKLSKDDVEALRKDPRVKYITPDHKIEAFAQTTPTGTERVAATANSSLDIDGKDDIRVDADVAVLDTGISTNQSDLILAARTNCVPSVDIGGTLDDPTGVAIDSEGNVWVADSKFDRVNRFNTAGEYLDQFGSSGTGPGQLDTPRDIDIDPEGNVWVADALNHRIQGFDPEGELLQLIGSKGSGQGQFQFPGGVAIDAEGNIWVGDTQNDRIQQFDPEGEWLKTVGAPGVNPGQFDMPTKIEIDAEENIWVADTGNHRVQVFDVEGEFLFQFGEKGSGNGQLHHPRGIAFDSEGNAWISEEGNHRVQKFDPEGKYLAQFGETGTGPGEFGWVGALDIAIDSEGSIFVADPENDRVQKFSPDPAPSFLLSFGYPGCANNTGTDDQGHGTHVAGTIGAIDDDKGVVGVAPGARVWAVKVLKPVFGGAEGRESWIIAGVDWVTARASHIEVANMSLGCLCSTPALEEAIEDSVDAGVVYVVAAGNEGIDAKFVSPAKNPDVIAVSALADYDGEPGAKAKPLTQLEEGRCEEEAAEDWEHQGSDDTLADFSNHGEVVDIAAPGVCILSTLPGGGFGFSSGTSMAAPHVAGAAAWLASNANPSSAEDVAAIRQSLIDEGSLNWTDLASDPFVESLLYLGDTDLPTEVATSRVLSPALNSATLGGSLNVRGQKTEYWFEYGKTTAYGQSAPVPAAELAAGSKYKNVSNAIEGLDEGTLYHFRLKATNSNGTAFSKDRTFRTPQAAPEYSFSFGSQGEGNGEFEAPEAIAIDSKGDVYVADNSTRIKKFDAEGNFLHQFGSLGDENGQFNGSGISGLAVDSKDNLYASDTGGQRIQKFDPAGEFISAFGSLGGGEGEFELPRGVAIDSEDNVYVVDSHNMRVQKFDVEGNYVLQFGTWGTGDGQFGGPQDIAIDGDDHIYVSDNSHRIQKFDAEGSYLSKLGSAGAEEGEFSGNVTIAIDAKGELYAADSALSRVQKFNSSGVYLSMFGSEGAGSGELMNPQGVAVHPEGGIYVVDAGNDRISVWNPPLAFPLATTGNATKTTSRSTTLNAIVNPQGAETVYQFEYGLTTAYGSKAPATPEEVGSGMSYVPVSEVIDGLDPGTTYHFRITAENNAGTSYGDDEMFTTEMPGWNAQHPSAGSSDESLLSGVSCYATDGCVAVGHRRDPEGEGGNLPIAQRWDGQQWSLESPPMPAGASSASLTDVSCLSGESCIAVGLYTEDESQVRRPLVEIWDGAEWTRHSVPQPEGAGYANLAGVSCTAPTACVAVGSHGEKTGGGGPHEWHAARWDGTEWSLLAVPQPEGASESSLKTISCTSGEDCVAGGHAVTGGLSKPTAVVWDGTEWSSHAAPLPESALLGFIESISCTSGEGCVAVGATLVVKSPSDYYLKPYAADWDGSEWSLQPTSAPPKEVTNSRFAGVSCISLEACVTVGYDLKGGEYQLTAQRWNGSEWTADEMTEPAPSKMAFLSDVSCTAIDSCAAVGAHEGDGLVELFR